METQDAVKYRNPIDYLKVFFRRRWLFITPLFIGFVLSILACFFLPPAWQSSAIILVEEEKIINPLIQNLAVSTTAVQRMQSIRVPKKGTISDIANLLRPYGDCP